MRLAAVVMLLTTLGACAEVTTFRRADGSVYHHVNCAGSLRLESCRNAAERTCPNGYARVAASATTSDDPAARCTATNKVRQENGEAPLSCPANGSRDSFFACK